MSVLDFDNEEIEKALQVMREKPKVTSPRQALELITKKYFEVRIRSKDRYTVSELDKVGYINVGDADKEYEMMNQIVNCSYNIVKLAEMINTDIGFEFTSNDSVQRVYNYILEFYKICYESINSPSLKFKTINYGINRNEIIEDCLNLELLADKLFLLHRSNGKIEHGIEKSGSLTALLDLGKRYVGEQEKIVGGLKQLEQAPHRLAFRSKLSMQEIEENEKDSFLGELDGLISI